MVTAYPLATGVDYADLGFRGQAGIIATGLIHGADGVAIVDPGPATCLPALENALKAQGFGWDDVRAVLLTHIHLDHAGASGHVLQAAKSARLYVHKLGARHMVDPTVLIASATRLYQRDMERLCTMCESKGRCARDLSADPKDPVWRKYCPNEPALVALVQAKSAL